MSRTVDPVGEPSAYQDMLLGLVGERDPVALQQTLVDEVEGMIDAAGQLLRTRPAPNEWSVLELVGHLLDGELVTAARYRWILAHDRPELAGYDQDLWVSRLGHNQGDPEAKLDLLRALRRSNLDLWERTPSGERERVGIHSERGPESYELTFRLTAGHGLFHLEQMERTLAAVRSSS